MRRETRVVFVADDGREFTSETKCRLHEIEAELCAAGVGVRALEAMLGIIKEYPALVGEYLRLVAPEDAE